MANVLFLGPARQMAGVGSLRVAAANVAEVRAALTARFGDEFGALLASSRVWVDGVPVDDDGVVCAESEVSILPPVSGGAM